MAEPVLLRFAKSILLEETNKLASFPTVISTLRKEFESLSGFLGDAKEIRDDDVFKKLMIDIEDLTYEAGEMTKKHSDWIERHRQMRIGLINIIKVICYRLSTAREKSQINHLSSQVSMMSSKMKAYGIKESQTAPSTINRTGDPSPVNITTTMVVGLEEDTKTIEDQLISTTGSTTRVIGIYGVNGLGKTTLAKEVFNSKKVADTFDAKTWVFVGQEDDQFSLKDVLQKMIRDLRINNVEEEEEEDVDEEEVEVEEGEIAEVNDDLKIIKKEIRKILKKKRCLVVLDDLQIASRWDQLKAAVSTMESSSKVVVTACDPDVLSPVDSHTFLHQHRFLNFKERDELFMETTESTEYEIRGISFP